MRTHDRLVAADGLHRRLEAHSSSIGSNVCMWLSRKSPRLNVDPNLDQTVSAFWLFWVMQQTSAWLDLQSHSRTPFTNAHWSIPGDQKIHVQHTWYQKLTVMAKICRIARPTSAHLSPPQLAPSPHCKWRNQILFWSLMFLFFYASHTHCLKCTLLQRITGCIYTCALIHFSIFVTS